MATRADLRAHCRRELNDGRPPFICDDATLNDFIDGAIVEYGERFPLAAVHHGSMIAGVRAYTLPADCLRVRAVEWPAGRFIPPERATMPAALAGEATTAEGLAQAWSWERRLQPLLTVRRAPTGPGAFKVHYEAGRSAPPNDVTPLPLDDAGRRVVVLMACRAAHDRWWLGEAQRGLRASRANPFDRRLERAREGLARTARGSVMHHYE